MARIIIALLLVTLTVYTFIDCAITPASDTPAKISKPSWLALILLVPVFGPAIWLYFKYQDVLSSDTKIAPMSASDIANAFRGKKSGPQAPVAPDDDPDFLARLDAQARRKAYEQRKAEEKAQAQEEKKEEGRSDHEDPEQDLA